MKMQDERLSICLLKRRDRFNAAQRMIAHSKFVSRALLGTVYLNMTNVSVVTVLPGGYVYCPRNS